MMGAILLCLAGIYSSGCASFSIQASKSPADTLQDEGRYKKGVQILHL